MKTKEKKDKVVEAYPNVSIFSDIMIMDGQVPLAIGGFSLGGFYLKEGFKMVENKSKNGIGDNVTYYEFIKDPKKKTDQEKLALKIKRKEQRHKKKREKELEEELKNLRKKK